MWRRWSYSRWRISCGSSSSRRTFVAGLVYFAVVPGLDAGAWQRAALNGALFGFFCYATYDLTNYATLRGWPLSIVVADLAWGAFVSTVAATAAFFITRAVGR